jgi:hypothetical protein
MHSTRARHWAHEINLQRNVRITHCSHSWKGFQVGFLLADGNQRRRADSQTCKACQFAAKHQRRLGALSQLITPTWPLQRWGIDIVGPLPTTQSNFKFAVVALEYFTKWIEARPIATITSATIRKFFLAANHLQIRYP